MCIRDSYRRNGEFRMLTVFVVAAVVLFIVITFFKGVRVVPQGFE